MRDFVEKEGKGILVIHEGAANIPCPGEDISDPACRWLMRGLRTQFRGNSPNGTRVTVYADSVGAGQVPPGASDTSATPSARNHGRMHPETRMIFENLPTNAGAGPLANRLYIWEGVGEQWFKYLHNPRLEGERVIDGVTYGPINILLSLDERSLAANAACNTAGPGCKSSDGDWPVAWTRKMGNGMLAFQSAGHSDIYTRERVVEGVQVHDSLFEKFNWRLMKYLARDFVGCMTPGRAQYNPEASVEQLHPGFDPIDPCGPNVGVRPGGVRREFRLATQGRLVRLDLAGAGQHRVLVSDIQGRPVNTQSVQGPGRVSLPMPESGRFVLKVTSPEGVFTRTFAAVGP